MLCQGRMWSRPEHPPKHAVAMEIDILASTKLSQASILLEHLSTTEPSKRPSLRANHTPAGTKLGISSLTICQSSIALRRVLSTFGALVSSRPRCSYTLWHTVRFAGVDLFASLLDLFQHGRIVDAFLGCNVGGLRFKTDVESLDTCFSHTSAKLPLHERVSSGGCDTIELLQHPLHSSRTSTASHLDIELVIVLGHFGLNGVADV
nr:hypothetical protein CFP56_52427 [Quercus suber]